MFHPFFFIIIRAFPFIYILTYRNPYLSLATVTSILSNRNQQPKQSQPVYLCVVTVYLCLVNHALMKGVIYSLLEIR